MRFWMSFAIFGLGVSLFLGLQSPATSGERSIFGETPSAVEGYFGPYWTRLTTQNTADDRIVVYTYSPGTMRSLFLNAEELRVSVTFVNDRAYHVKVHDNGGGFNIPANPSGSQQNSTRVFDDVFEYIFGYRPPTSSPVYRRLLNPGALHGTLHMVTYCMSEGIAMSYEWISTEDYIWFIDFFREPACL